MLLSDRQHVECMRKGQRQIREGDHKKKMLRAREHHPQWWLKFAIGRLQKTCHLSLKTLAPMIHHCQMKGSPVGYSWLWSAERIGLYTEIGAAVCFYRRWQQVYSNMQFASLAEKASWKTTSRRHDTYLFLLRPSMGRKNRS